MKISVIWGSKTPEEEERSEFEIFSVVIVVTILYIAHVTLEVDILDLFGSIWIYLDLFGSILRFPSMKGVNWISRFFLKSYISKPLVNNETE